MIILLTLLLVSAVRPKPLITREYLDQLRKTVSWKVSSYEDNVFKGWTEEEFLSTLPDIDHSLPVESTADSEIFKETKEPKALPENFDGRVKWGTCIHPIRNQGKCGSCWAIALTDALSDRFCINGRDVLLSPQQIISCLKGADFKGCYGGHGVNAMSQYVIPKGLVTDKCYPYEQVDHEFTLQCSNKCTYLGNWNERYYCKHGSDRVIEYIEDMKQEIINNGPLCTRFKFRTGFTAYAGGKVYDLSLIHICRCRRYAVCRSRWSPYH
eukprot:TRINITY_DN14767_c0_g1_i7.p1 TRINITY_DN14767_c0_g1~~TRINITY_DN14767_c0_g1_i7.p1  ORF type:complete len:268 (+),score=40.45 TRINITY_DN14767_c0_g1_i7:196-999(+)